MLQYHFKTKARSISGWWGGGPSAAHPSRRKDFFSPLGSSHPSEKGPLLPVFYETPTHQPSNCSQHVLWFYVSNKKQLHLHKTCFFSSRLSPGGWGDSLPSSGHVSWTPLLPRWHCPETRGHEEIAISQQFFCLLLPERQHRKPVTWLPGGAQAGGRQAGKSQPHGTKARTTTSASQPAGPWQRASPSRFDPRASRLFQTRTHTKQQIITSQLSGQQQHFHTHPQKSGSFWI